MDNKIYDENGNRWNVYSLKEHFELAIDSMEVQTNLGFILRDKAIEKAEVANIQRLDKMNEVREQLREQALTFLRKEEYLLNDRLLNQKIDSLSKLVYVGLGVWIILQVVLSFVISLIIKV